MTERTSGSGAEAAFGEEFRPLMRRIRHAVDALGDGGGRASGRALSWREASRPFELEAEALIAKHCLEGPLAAYVRHVVHEGFDVDFDPMDPSPHS